MDQFLGDIAKVTGPGGGGDNGPMTQSKTCKQQGT